MSAPEAPYPATTAAKGWRFELDYERIDRSATWALANEVPLAQPCLLAMWLAAWRQVPCGSMPNDEDVIRALCRIPADTWDAVRSVVMRGWWLAADGLLYHDTLIECANEMMARRRSDADRQAMRRAKSRVTPTDAATEEAMAKGKPLEEPPPENENVTRDTPVTPTEVHRESSTGTGTSTSTREVSLKPSPTSKALKKPGRSKNERLDASDLELPEGVPRDAWVKWANYRRTHKAPWTKEVAEASILRLQRLARLGHDVLDTVEHAIASGHQGLYPDHRTRPALSAVPAAGEAPSWKRERDERIYRMTGGNAGKAPADQRGEIIDMEQPDGPPAKRA